MAAWHFITNHGTVLVLIAQRRQITARVIAEALGLTERPVRRIIAELEAAGYLQKKRVGRVNQYEVALDLPLRQSVHREVAVGDLLHIFPNGADAAMAWTREAGDDAAGGGFKHRDEARTLS